MIQYIILVPRNWASDMSSSGGKTGWGSDGRKDDFDDWYMQCTYIFSGVTHPMLSPFWNITVQRRTYLKIFETIIKVCLKAVLKSYWNLILSHFHSNLHSRRLFRREEYHDPIPVPLNIRRNIFLDIQKNSKSNFNICSRPPLPHPDQSPKIRLSLGLSVIQNMNCKPLGITYPPH